MSISTKMTILITGLPGSGKSYFAERLATKLDAEYLNSDKTRKALFSSPSYSKEHKNLVYMELENRMYTLLKKGKNVVLDATFYKTELRERFVRKAGEAGSGVIFIEVIADEKLIKQRLSKKRLYSDADFNVYQLLKKQLEPLKEAHLTIESTNDNINKMLEEAFEYIKKRRDDQG